MRRPGPAPPSPVRKDELQCPVGGCARQRAMLDGGQCLRGGLRSHRGGQDGVTCGRFRPLAYDLRQDERPGGIVAGADVIEAQQAGGVPGHYERAHDSDRLTCHDRQVRYRCPGQLCEPLDGLASGKNYQVGPDDRCYPRP